MQEIATEVLRYLQGNIPLTLVIAWITGFLASKTVTHWNKSNIFTYLVIGVLGFFVGQFVSRYVGLQAVFDLVSNMQLLFDILIAYFGSFAVAAVVHLFKPM